jgi:hypothetical protein
MTTGTQHPAIRETTNRLSCDPPEVVVRDGCRSFVPYTDRWHRTLRGEFPKIEFVPHPDCPEVGFDVCVTHDAATDELEGNVCAFRLRPGTRAVQFKGSIPFNSDIERRVEKRGLLNV